MKKGIVIGVIACPLLMAGCSSSNVLEGSFTGAAGTIVLDSSQIEFVGMDEAFLRDTYASGEAGKAYFESYREGVILTEDEVVALKNQYYEAFDPAPYADRDYAYTCEYNASEYLWEYFLTDEDGNAIWAFTYYEAEDYIDFQGETFYRQ